MRNLVLVCCAVIWCGSAIAQQSSSSANSKAGASGNVQEEMYFQLQQLQREVMDLRGQLEEQAYQIKKLTKQRKDDYVNLDQRLSALQGGGEESSRRSVARSFDNSERRAATVSRSAAALPTGDPSAEADVYKSAYALVKQQQFAEALAAFDDFILLYPNGEYAPNAHYWLGELYLYESNLSRAIDEFSIIVNEHPTHRKAPDALFKLAKAHHVKGDIELARSMLNRVVSDYKNSDSNAPKLASDYLKNMLQ